MLGPLKRRIIRKPKEILQHVHRVVGTTVRVYGGSRMGKDPVTGKWKYIRKPLKRMAMKSQMDKAFRDLPKKMNIFNPNVDERAYANMGKFFEDTIGEGSPVPVQDPEVAKEDIKAKMYDAIMQAQSGTEKARMANTTDYDNPDQATNAENNVVRNIDMPSLSNTYQKLLDSLKRWGAIK